MHNTVCNCALNDCLFEASKPPFTEESHFSLYSYTYITMGNSLSCNSPLTKSCLGEKDSCYNPNVSNNLIEQNPIWEKYAGYWGPTQTNAQLLDGPPCQPALHNITSGEGLPYKSDVFKGFRLIKVDGSRYTVQGIYIYKPPPESFCNQRYVYVCYVVFSL